MSMMKKRAEAARRKRIDHVFVKADDNSNGKITPQQMIKLFSANGLVNILSLCFGSFSGLVKSSLHECFNDKFMYIHFQVVDADLEKDAKGLAERDGWILKQNFIKYALGTDLCKDDPSQERVFSGKVRNVIFI